MQLAPGKAMKYGKEFEFDKDDLSETFGYGENSMFSVSRFSDLEKELLQSPEKTKKFIMR